MAAAVAAGLCALCVVAASASASASGHVPCRPAGLVVYTAVLTTNWTRARFPKQFPEFRPAAQWSRTVGASHSEHYRLFQLGAQASPELKLFVETGKQEVLGNGQAHVLDEFLLPAIGRGAGTAAADFIVDTNHSKVSLVARIVPSPDWFVGIDSLDLCPDGHWMDTFTSEASPLDAGTDSGFTFTAPNWATNPQEPIYRITAQYPRHPANSFHYPSLPDLPAIATFHIHKKSIYELHSLPTEPAPTRPEPSTDSPVQMSLPETLADNQEVQLNDILPWKHVKNKVRKKKRSKTHRVAKECEVGAWTEWSACNAPCGQSKRTRQITRPGLLCPPLLQERTCGCTKYIFNW